MKIQSAVVFLLSALCTNSLAVVAEELAGTQPLTVEGDIAGQMVDGVDRFLLRQIDRSVAQRDKHWNRDFTSKNAYSKSIEPNRQRLRKIIGANDDRKKFSSLEFVATSSVPQLIEDAGAFKIFAVRWPVLRNVHGEGLWLVPKDPAQARVVAIPDADQTPENISGIGKVENDVLPFARQLAANGCEVLVPMLISRDYKARNGRAKMTDREYLYRSAFVLGKHLIGFEVQKVLGAVDWFSRHSSRSKSNASNAASPDLPIGIVGYGEGGLIAMYAAALDTRIDAACVSGYFGSRQAMWQQPISRNVFGLLEQFGDAEIASMIAPRPLVVDSGSGPVLRLPSEGGAPAILDPPTFEEAEDELNRLESVMRPLKFQAHHVSSQTNTHGVSAMAVTKFWSLLTGQPGDRFDDQVVRAGASAADHSSNRRENQFGEMEQHNQWLLGQSPSVRRGFMNLGSDLSDKREGRYPIDTSSTNAYQASIDPYREYFRTEVIGEFDLPMMDFNAKSRKLYDEADWVGYEVMLDVFPDVFAYGILCLPKDLGPGEKRPVVVCQHGLEGRPQDTIRGDHWAYHDYAAKLAQRGYITFAPQNLYIGKDRFRTLQRKANPIKATLFSIIVPQHQQIVNWLKTQPNVDANRIAFYGLSYGGKSAMRVPALVPDYCLSICSADFNEWVDKNASTRENYSYVWTNEYEIFEFDPGGTFNYAEMAALIAPRPFMVERGHFDQVGTDENVAHEFAKVRFLYAARLGIPERCAIEWFAGPHTINGKGTFNFLDRHLNFQVGQSNGITQQIND